MENNYCIYNLLKLICLLQENSTSACSFQNECQKPFLGPTTVNPYYNTRVVSFYKKDGTLFTTDIDGNTSSYFRIMNVENNSVTLLILINNDNTYTTTNQLITINISCICAIRCIEDIYLTNL